LENKRSQKEENKGYIKNLRGVLGAMQASICTEFFHYCVVIILREAR
jgi:hypothetical protein